MEHVGKLNKVEYEVTFHKVEHWLLELDVFRFSKPSAGIYKQ